MWAWFQARTVRIEIAAEALEVREDDRRLVLALERIRPYVDALRASVVARHVAGCAYLHARGPCLVPGADGRLVQKTAP